MRRTKAESEATAAALLDEAARQLAAVGWAQVSLESVSTAAGVTRGAVAHHYGTKRHLFERVVERAQHSVGERVAAAADAVDDPWEALLVGCRTFLEAVLADPVRRILLVDAPAVLGWEAWREQDAAASGRHLVEALEVLVRDGVVAVTSVEATSALLSGAMNEAALWAAAHADEDAVGRAVEEAWADLRRLLDGLRAKRASSHPPRTTAFSELPVR